MVTELVGGVVGGLAAILGDEGDEDDEDDVCVVSFRY